MTVYLLNGTKRHHPRCHARVRDGVLYITKTGHYYSEEEAAYPLTSVERWTP